MPLALVKAGECGMLQSMPDKYTATWVSHSSSGDFLRCPRAYFLNNVYKNPATGRKINLVTPSLALGQAVHEALESLLLLPAEKRFKEPLPEKFERAWSKFSGQKGGFESEPQEEEARQRGLAMVKRVQDTPGPLANKAVRLSQDLPYYFLSEEDNIILCGKIDWLEHVPEDDSVHVIDFKTGKRDEKGDSLQLPIYSLLLKNCQQRRVSRASYWYLDRDDKPTAVKLPDVEQARRQVLQVARQIKRAREQESYACPRGEQGCFFCRPLEAIAAGRGKMVGISQYGQELYVLPAGERVRPA